MRVRRARLGVRLVAVVPHRHQPELRHRRECRRPRADHHPSASADCGEEGAIAGCRAEVGRERDEAGRAEDGFAGGRQSLEVACIGGKQEGTTPRCSADGRGLCERERPVGPRHRGPDGARRLRAGDRIEESRRVRRPLGPRREDRRTRWLIAAQRLGFDLRVPRRDRQPRHIREHPGVPIGDRTTQVGHLRCQHLLGRDDLAHPQQLAVVVGLGEPLQHESVEVLAGKTNLHPGARLSRLGHVVRDEIVERPVQMREGDIDRDPCHRQRLGDLGRLFGPGFAHGVPQQRQLLRRVRCHRETLVGPGDSARNAATRLWTTATAGSRNCLGTC